MKKKLVGTICTLVLFSSIAAGCSNNTGNTAETQNTSTATAETTTAAATTQAASTAAQTTQVAATEQATTDASKVTYNNTEYGFSIALPDSWDGYTVLTDSWSGSSTNSSSETGTELLIRNPAWTEADPHLDIPILIFTIAQWDSLQNNNFSISGAPMNPSELGRNSKYVFALPARYYYSFLTGFEEVMQIMDNGAFTANENLK